MVGGCSGRSRQHSVHALRAPCSTSPLPHADMALFLFSHLLPSTWKRELPPNTICCFTYAGRPLSHAPTSAPPTQHPTGVPEKHTHHVRDDQHAKQHKEGDDGCVVSQHQQPPPRLRADPRFAVGWARRGEAQAWPTAFNSRGAQPAGPSRAPPAFCPSVLPASSAAASQPRPSLCRIATGAV